MHFAGARRQADPSEIGTARETSAARWLEHVADVNPAPGEMSKSQMQRRERQSHYDH